MESCGRNIDKGSKSRCRVCLDIAYKRTKERAGDKHCRIHTGELLISDTRRCLRCLEHLQEKRARLYKQGLCVTHQKPLLPGRKVCKLCQEYAADYYAKRVTAGCCASCKTPTTGKSRCHVCLQASHRSKLKAYGLTADDYDRILRCQNGVCAICRKSEVTKHSGATIRLAVDHDHRTGAVRGLLCSLCNRFLGLVGEDSSLISDMITYLAADGSA